MHSLPALALFLTALSSTAQAVANIALYPNPGCTGSGLVCLAIAPGACCSTASQVWASARITGSSVGDNRNLRGYSHPSCTGTQTGLFGGTSCLGASFSIHSARSFSTGDRGDDNDNPPPNKPPGRRSLGKRLAEPEPEGCHEPDHVQYVTKNGEKQLRRIPEGKLEIVVKALLEGRDVEGVF